MRSHAIIYPARYAADHDKIHEAALAYLHAHAEESLESGTVYEICKLPPRLLPDNTVAHQIFWRTEPGWTMMDAYTVGHLEERGFFVMSRHRT